MIWVCSLAHNKYLNHCRMLFISFEVKQNCIFPIIMHFRYCSCFSNTFYGCPRLHKFLFILFAFLTLFKFLECSVPNFGNWILSHIKSCNVVYCYLVNFPFSHSKKLLFPLVPNWLQGACCNLKKIKRVFYAGHAGGQFLVGSRFEGSIACSPKQRAVMQKSWAFLVLLPEAEKSKTAAKSVKIYFSHFKSFPVTFKMQMKELIDLHYFVLPVNVFEY